MRGVCWASRIELSRFWLKNRELIHSGLFSPMNCDSESILYHREYIHLSCITTHDSQLCWIDPALLESATKRPRVRPPPLSSASSFPSPSSHESCSIWPTDRQNSGQSSRGRCSPRFPQSRSRSLVGMGAHILLQSRADNPCSRQSSTKGCVLGCVILGPGSLSLSLFEQPSLFP